MFDLVFNDTDKKREKHSRDKNVQKNRQRWERKQKLEKEKRKKEERERQLNSFLDKTNYLIVLTFVIEVNFKNIQKNWKELKNC